MSVAKILLVDDDSFVRELYQKVLIQSGFEVITSFDGQDGVEKSLLLPDLILMDVMMPRLNGIDALSKIKQNNQTKNIPIILLTNVGEEDIINKATAMGAAGYIVKNRVTPYEVVEHVRDFLQTPTVVE